MRFGISLAAAGALVVSVGTAAAAAGLSIDVRDLVLTLVGPRERPSAVREIPSAADLPSAAPHNFYFVRARYTDAGFFSDYKDWRTDFPKADLQFLAVLRRLARLDAHDGELAVRLDDRDLRRFPYLYAVEVGQMRLTEAEVLGLRDYLLAGGFLVVDDFWGTLEWRRFEAQMKRVFPEYSIREILLSHPVFHAYYDIDEIVQVPNVGLGVRGGPTHESDGYRAAVHGIFDGEGRLMVAINWNTDLGDAWEWAEHPQYPLKFSTYAYQMGVNFIVYAMSH